MIRISALIKDPDVRAAFWRIERDAPGALVIADKPKPVLAGGAVRELADA
ncbi:hypothetical protein [Aurantimonas coralicida]|nr:hypothetical protein [Aurantimonas coralicida]MCD1645289.1 hypothetical protein [Aurantimonas coralicida]